MCRAIRRRDPLIRCHICSPDADVSNRRCVSEPCCYFNTVCVFFPRPHRALLQFGSSGTKQGILGPAVGRRERKQWTEEARQFFPYPDSKQDQTKSCFFFFPNRRAWNSKQHFCFSTSQCGKTVEENQFHRILNLKSHYFYIKINFLTSFHLHLSVLTNLESKIQVLISIYL